MKCTLLCFAMLLTVTATTAQTHCSARDIYGIWKQCGNMRTPNHYDSPPPLNTINIDSLKSELGQYDTSKTTWTFTTNGTFIRRSETDNRKGRFWIAENNCTLMLSTRKKDPIRIMHLDDSYLILWHNNPKTAYLTVYRR